MRLKEDARSQAASLSLLSTLALSPLAGMADLDLLWALNSNFTLNEVETDFVAAVDESDFVTDDEQDTVVDDHDAELQEDHDDDDEQ